jgi:CBS-domain-containing membrane protein
VSGAPHIVRDVMTRDVAAVGRDAAFRDIVRMMQDREVSAVPVVDGTARVRGIVSEADLLPKESSATATPTGTPSCAGCPTSPRRVR